MEKDHSLFEILDALRVNVCITDIETDDVIFMNQQMKETFHQKDIKGKKCYDIRFHKNHQPCEFCPKRRLKVDHKHRGVLWEDYDETLKRTFQNYDIILPWTNGKMVHLHQCIDITDMITINQKTGRDFLCHIWNRWAGKEMLANAYELAKEELTTMQVVMIDINHMKEINQMYGHQEGDFLLQHVSEFLSKHLQEPDFVFRLSGDEFVIVLMGKDEKQAAKYMIELSEGITALKQQYQKEYEFAFCYGIYQVPLQENAQINEIIAQADELMYEHKLRHYRTYLAKKKENLSEYHDPQENTFVYDSSLLYQALINSTDDFVYLCDVKTNCFRYPPALVHMFHLPSEVIQNPLSIWKEIVHPQDWDRFYKSNMEIGENQMDYHSVEFRAKTRTGEYVWLKCRGQLMRDAFGEPSLFAGVMTQLDRQNKIDPMTHLLNSQEFEKCGKEKLNDFAVENLGIMILDVDEFQLINEIYGRQAGDLILKMLGQLLQSVLPGNANLFKLDSDRFGVLMANCCEEDIKQYFQEIQKKLYQHHFVEEQKIVVQISAGAMISEGSDADFESLDTYVMHALDHAKANGNNQLRFFEISMLDEKKRILNLQRSLRESISKDFYHFSLAYQPQIDVKENKMKGVEALLRWKDHALGSVSPAEFIPLLERSGMIVPVGTWVLRKAVQDCKQWIEMNPEFTVSVNVSALQILHGNFADTVERILKEEAFPAENLILELTESNMVPDIDVFKQEFRKLHQLHIKLAMDDFGTGYSSLENLKRGIMQIVKIDRAFVKDIANSRFDAVFIRFMVEICHAVGIHVCLEGIETLEELNLVKDMELDHYQGYLFGKPMDASKIKERLIKEKTMDE